MVGQKVLNAHGLADASSPVLVVANTDKAADVAQAMTGSRASATRATDRQGRRGLLHGRAGGRRHVPGRLRHGRRGAQLMGGVGDEVALGLDRALEGIERVVEGLSQTAQLAAAADVDPFGVQPVRIGGDRLGLPGEPGDRGQRRPRDHQPSSAASAIPPRR